MPSHTEEEQKRQGLLGRLLNAETPVGGAVQGGLMAALTGFNPLLGVIGGPIISGDLQKSRLDREKLALDNDVMRATLARQKRQDDAAIRLPELLMERTEIPGEEIPSRYGLPSSLRERLSAPTEVATLSTPEGQRELQGILAQMAPGTYAESILKPPQPGRVESLNNAFRKVFGRDMNEEEFQLYHGPGGLAAEDQLRITALTLEVNKTLNELNQQIRDKNLEDDRQANLIKDSMDSSIRAWDALGKLDETFLRTGGSMMDLKRTGAAMAADLASLFGLTEESDKIQSIVDAYDKFQKETAILARNVLNSVSNITDTRQRLLEQGSAGTAVSPGTNRAILMLALEESLRAADQRGIRLSVAEREKYQDILENMQKRNFVFFSEREIEDAVRAGVINVGDTVTLNGQATRVGGSL